MYSNVELPPPTISPLLSFSRTSNESTKRRPSQFYLPRPQAPSAVHPATSASSLFPVSLSTAPKDYARSSVHSGLRTPPGDDLYGAMGSITHHHHLHHSHHHHHSASLADYEGRHHVGSASHAPSSISEADRTRAVLSEAQAALTLGPSSSTHHSHNNQNNAARAMNHGVDVLHAQSSQQHATYPLQLPIVDRLSSSSLDTFLTPPTSASSQEARQAALVPQILSNSLSSNQPTPPISTHIHTSTMTGASGAANGAVNGAANGGTHRKTISITEKDSLAMVVHSPEVPRCISPKGGSISDFTAEMTCLFWFEAPSVYQQAENIDKMSPTAWVPRLSANAFPSDGFRSWVNRMINTTQVTQNVILLALLFIYRLKFLNVIVRGKPGSEFRLLTVALMLGNKFLDDNTYTNKTWSDVSGLHVKEIHVMEVEFLSNMRYSLLVSKDEWEEWLVKLAKFRMYYERASTSTLSPPNLSPPRPLASPMSSPTTYHSASTGNTSLSPQAVGSTYPVPAYSPTSSRPTFAPVPATVQLPAWPGQLPTPHGDAALGGRNGSAKRSMSFEDITEPPPKRSSRYVSPGTTLPPPIPSQAVAPQSGALAVPTAMSSAYGAQTSNLPANLATAPAEARRLPAPQLTLNTAAAQVHAPTQLGIQTANAHAGYPPAMSMQQQQQVTPMSQVQVPMALPPPLAHGVRAMATVYSSNPTASGAPALPSAAPTAPATTTGYAVQPPMLTTSGPVASMVPVAPTANASNTSYTAPQTFGTPTKRMSPMNTLTPNAASVYAAAGANSSPLGESFPHLASGVHTPLTHSPSVYLQQRSSPYRPIRNVHMLLNPPPTSSLQDYQSMGPILIPPTQMYYNPLGRPNDLRPGIVPEFQGLQPPFRHGASLTPIHALQQPAMQMPVRDARVQQAQQQQAQQQQQQQQQLLAHAQAYAHQQSQYNN